MKIRWAWLLLVPVVAALGGCGGGPVSDEGQPPDAPPPPRLGDSIDFSLADLLSKPRAELANMADEALARLRLQKKAQRDKKDIVPLLPALHPPLAVPVLREAKFSERAGFSLPPYAAPGTTDTELALHLARYGDAEAARRLVDPADADAARQIDQLALERNYPVEWTRLVAMLLDSAQLRLATGDLDGGTEIVQVHRQLQQLLDARAAHGPLGAALLSRGRKALTLAQAAWTEAKQAELTSQAHKALASWGGVPASTVAVPVGEPRTRVARLLHSDSQGRVLPAKDVLRALDLFGVPVPDEGAETVLAFFDKAERLANVRILYRPKLSDAYPDASDLAQLLLEQLQPPGQTPGADSPEASEHGVRRCTCRTGDVTCDVAVVSRGNTIGGMVRLHGELPTDDIPTLARDFGEAHLDRSYEQNRLRLAPEQQGPTIQTDRSAVLARLTNPLPLLHPAQVSLQREAGQDVVARLTIRYAVEHNPPPLGQLALPLWSALGAARIEGVDDETGGHLALRWEDEQTRYTLRLPHASAEAPELEIADRQPPENLPQRAARAVEFDRAERKARFAAGKLVTRLPRAVDPNAFQLGMSRDAVLRALPSGKGILRQNLADGVVVTWAGEPPRGVLYMVRQLFARFDAAGRLAEIRVRYQDTSPPGSNKGLKDLLAGLRKRGGVPAEVPNPWAAVWADVGGRKPVTTQHRWLDDATLLTFRWEDGGAEVTLRDCPADQETGVALPPLECLPRGPERCSLGDARDPLLRRWGVAEPTTSGGALVLTPTQPGPYDAVMVWFEGDRAVRIVARHTQPASQLQPAQLADALSDAWSHEIRSLGWTRRQDVTDAGVLQGLGWHDDCTRVRLFWQEPDQGPPRLYTEWKELR
jgi:hypothetical protein